MRWAAQTQLKKQKEYSIKNQECQTDSVDDSQQEFIKVQFVQDTKKQYVRCHNKNYSSPNILNAINTPQFSKFQISEKNKTITFFKTIDKQTIDESICKENLQTAPELFYQVQKKRKLQTEIVKRTTQKKNQFYEKLKTRIKYQLCSLQRNYMIHSQAKREKIQNLKQMLDECQNRKHCRKINFRRKEESGRTVNSNVGGKGYDLLPTKGDKNEGVFENQLSITRASTKKIRNYRQKLKSDASEFEQKTQNNHWHAFQDLNNTRSYKMIPKSALVRKHFVHNTNLTDQIQGKSQQLKYLSNNLMTELRREKQYQPRISCIKKHKRNFTTKCNKQNISDSIFLLTNRINKQNQRQQVFFENYQRKRPLTSKVRSNKIEDKIKDILGTCKEQQQNLGQIKKNINLFGYYCQKLDSKLQRKAKNINLLILKKQYQQQKRMKKIKKRK